MVHVARRVTVLVCFALLGMVHARAQFSSSVQGNVMDSRGAVIGKATVDLTNVDTGVTQSKASDDTGSYRFVSIAPGNYEVAATAAGFTTSKVRFTLRTEENHDVTITLAVGQVASSVSVTAQAPLLDTSDSRSELTIDTQAIQALPLPGRNPTSLIALAPGVSGLGSAGYNNFFTENADYSANGRGNNGNQYVLDGLDINIDVNPGY